MPKKNSENVEQTTQQFVMIPIEKLHPHKLRHSFASVAITHGADVVSVSEKLGHANAGFTLKQYAHANEESIKRAGDIFRDAIENA